MSPPDAILNDPVTEEEWQDAVRIAKTVLYWATLEIQNHPQC
ncbi:MAG: hypothetical protein WD708_07880 [Kiritimatiellia bacterium]